MLVGLFDKAISRCYLGSVVNWVTHLRTNGATTKEMREHPELANMRTLQKGNRLSITPVDPKEWAFIETLLK